MQLLRASQIASFIENGTHDFPYRDPQSDRIVPPIVLTSKELKALGSLGELNKKAGLKGTSSNCVLGCCGDCEQLVFENWVTLIRKLLGFGEGIEEFNKVMAEHGHTKTESDFLTRNLDTFIRKATTALENKIPHKSGILGFQKFF